jgi:quinol-cytochrome oxidoreductase complex cytochrome b subunit
MPNGLGDPDNYIPANPMVTPAHIVPEWYFLPFYAILRSFTIDIHIPFTSVVFISSKLGGVILMFSAVLLLFVLPWLDPSPVRSGTFRPLFRIFFWILVVTCVALTWVGSQLPQGWPVILGQICTAYYFMFFLVILPLLPKFEKTQPLPKSISETVLKKV